MQNKNGEYTVYKGYCVGPACFSLQQAQRLSGDWVPPSTSLPPSRRSSGSTITSHSQNHTRQRRISRTRSVMNGLNSPLHVDADSGGGPLSPETFVVSNGSGEGWKVTKADDDVFPPPDLRRSANLQANENEPLFVIREAAKGLRQVATTITILDLSGFELRHLDYGTLSDGLKVNNTLTALILENAKLDDTSAQSLATGLEEAKDIPLRKLALGSNQLGDKGMNSLSSFLQTNVYLEDLDVSWNCLSNAGALALFSAFHRNDRTRIQTINLAHNSLSDIHDKEYGIKPFLRRNRTVRILNLEGNLITDESVISLAEGIKENNQTCLEHLYLGWNDIGDEGTVALAEMLEGNTTLRVLGLGENSIQNLGAWALLAAMDTNTTIRDISGLWRNRVDRRFIIVAIRRLLLSTESEEDSQKQRYEQAPSNKPGRPILDVESEELIDPDTLSKGGVTTISDISNDIENGGNASYRSGEGDSTDWGRGNTIRTHLLQTEEPTRPLDEKGINLFPLTEGEGSAYDGVTYFQSAPLTFFDRESGARKAIPLLDFHSEISVIKETLDQVPSAGIKLAVEVASESRFNAFMHEGRGHMMHFSCSGHLDHLPLENKDGSLHPLPADRLRRLITAGGCRLRLVFVVSRSARSIAQVFLDAGVPHVIACQMDHRFRDMVGLEFTHAFYRAISSKKDLRQAFEEARVTAAASPHARLLRLVSNRFQLLPEAAGNEAYHKVLIFNQTGPSKESIETAIPERAQLPNVPEHFLGREIEMYEILEALRAYDVVRVTGAPRNGKDTVVAAACQYAFDRRQMRGLDNIFWLPAPEGIVPDEDSLYGDLCLCINLIKTAHSDIWESDDLLLECRERIEIEMEGLQVLLVINEREFSRTGVSVSLEKFMSFLLNSANAKVILLSNHGLDATSSISQLSGDTPGTRILEANVEIAPLDLKATARLFGGTSKFISSSGCPAAHDAAEFADLLEPPFISKTSNPNDVISQRRTDLYVRMGSGIPSAIHAAATSMPKDAFIDLINVANRPEIYVDSLASLEREVRRRSAQRTKCIEEKNFLRAMDLDIILGELEEMRAEFPTLEELKEEEDLMKGDLKEAIDNQRYDAINELKRELISVKKKIMREQRLLPNSEADQAANDTLGEFQAQMKTMMEECALGGSLRSIGDGGVTFAIQCDQHRDCSFVVRTGEVHDFEHLAEARGIVVWANEGCDLTVTSIGNKLLEKGGPNFAQDLQDLPQNLSSPYGPVRCGIGNAVFLGPGHYGDLDAPCVILSVGPLSPDSQGDTRRDTDSDSIHYITNMLRSCYRSSMVLAKHAELQVLALSLLTTRATGQAYQQTLRVGLQTLTEEVKFSHLRDIHILASSNREMSILVGMLRDMGHQQI